MKLPNIAKIAWVKQAIIRNKACSLGPDAQGRVRLGLARQPAKREDTNVEQTGNSWKQLQFKDMTSVRTQETAGSRETPRQEGKTLLQAD